MYILICIYSDSSFEVDLYQELHTKIKVCEIAKKLIERNCHVEKIEEGLKTLLDVMKSDDNNNNYNDNDDDDFDDNVNNNDSNDIDIDNVNDNQFQNIHSSLHVLEKQIESLKDREVSSKLARHHISITKLTSIHNGIKEVLDIDNYGGK